MSEITPSTKVPLSLMASIFGTAFGTCAFLFYIYHDMQAEFRDLGQRIAVLESLVSNLTDK